MPTPLASETSDIAVWPETFVLLDCNGGEHSVRGRYYKLSDSALGVLASNRGGQVHCETPATDLSIDHVIRTVDGVRRRHRVIDQERMVAIFSHLRMSVQTMWTAVP